ncbi:MAG TPA: hypothetical protein VGZ52_04060, partial [Acidimicrobiales bacterium]|nr:hypothetical protein [Acidimicrobiales bacterium]
MASRRISLPLLKRVEQVRWDLPAFRGLGGCKPHSLKLAEPASHRLRRIVGRRNPVERDYAVVRACSLRDDSVDRPHRSLRAARERHEV